jgi:hypothetical protein
VSVEVICLRENEVLPKGQKMTGFGGGYGSRDGHIAHILPYLIEHNPKGSIILNF